LDECAAKGETKEMISWQKENEKLRLVVENILSDFYQNRDISEDVRIKLKI
jgi:hypothetical protein